MPNVKAMRKELEPTRTRMGRAEKAHAAIRELPSAHRVSVIKSLLATGLERMIEGASVENDTNKEATR